MTMAQDDSKARRWGLAWAAAALAVAGCARVAVAQDPAASPAPSKITVNGFVSAAYSHNLDEPASETNTLRVFDFDDRRVKLDVAEVVVQKAVASRGEFGFRVDVAAGQSIPRITAASGLFRDSETGEAEDVDLQQAFVGWMAPVGQGLKLEFGKFVTPTGAEVIEGYDGFNDNYSRSILFGYAIPFTHTGARVSYSFGKATLTGYALQGWDVFKDNNDGKTFGGQLALNPSPKLGVYATFLTGPERADSDDARRLVDLVAVWKPTSSVSLTGNYDWAREDGATAAGGQAEWNGIAGVLRVSLTPSVALSVRGERFKDRDGVRTGVAQEVSEFTLTPEFRFRKHFVLRGDFRRDSSDAFVFEDGDASSDTQTTVAVNLIAFF